MATHSNPKQRKRRAPKKRDAKSKKDLEQQRDSIERGVGTNSPSSSDNDWSWYANNEYLLRDSASLAFSNAAGVSVGLSASNLDATPAKVAFPGIWSISIAPAVGNAQAADDPVNIAARNIYSYVRHANSGHANYDAPNLMLYLLAMDSLYSAYSFCARAYGLMRTYSQKNRFIPGPLFQAMGLDYNDFLANQVQFRYWLNTVAEKIGSLCVPASMTYMMRHMWMFQNVFVDNMGLKAQMFIYTPEYFLKYVPTASVGGGTVPALQNTLRFTPSGTLLTVSDIMTGVNDMIEAVMQEEDLNIMSGDILKAFGEGSVWKLVPIHEDYDISAVYSDEVLHQIHNIVPLNTSPYAASGAAMYKMYEYVDATTATSFIKSPSFTMSGTVGPGGIIFDLHTDEPTPALNMVASRLTVAREDLAQPSQSASSVPAGAVDACGSEVATVMYVTTPDPLNPGRFATTPIFGCLNATSPTSALIMNLLNVANFHMHPMIYVYSIVANGGTPATYSARLTSIAGDLDNYTLITKDVLKKMHETALLSEFNVPLMGSWAHKLY